LLANNALVRTNTDTKDERLNRRRRPPIDLFESEDSNNWPFKHSSKKCSICIFRLGLYWTLDRVSLSGQSVKSCCGDATMQGCGVGGKISDSGSNSGFPKFSTP